MLLIRLFCLGLGASLFLTGCVSISTDPIRTERTPGEVPLDEQSRIAQPLRAFFDPLDRVDPSLAGGASGEASTTGRRQRQMAERLDEVSQLKRDGLLGENNRGYLHPRRTLTERQADLVEDENDDRREIYDDIADDLDFSIRTVGRVRARELELKSQPGIWLQGIDGIWYRKE